MVYTSMQTGCFFHAGLLKLLESPTAEEGLSSINGLFHIDLYMPHGLLKKFTSFHVGTGLQRI